MRCSLPAKGRLRKRGAECYLANGYDEVKSWIAERKARAER